MTEIVNAVHLFLTESLGIPVYPENGIPEDAVLPYATYTPVQTDWDADAVMPVRIWDRSPNYIRLNTLCDAMSDALGDFQVIPAGERGFLHLYKGSPWAQPQPMQDTDQKVMYLNFGISTVII